MEEVEILKELDESEEGLSLEDLSYILGQKKDVIKLTADKLVLAGVIVCYQGRYMFADEYYHLGQVRLDGKQLKLVTKNGKMMNVDAGLLKKDDYVVYTSNGRGKYKIVRIITIKNTKLGEITTIDGKNCIVTDKEAIPIDSDLAPGTIVEYMDSENIKIVRVVGSTDEPDIEIKKLAFKFGIPSAYPSEVIKEAEKSPTEVTENEILGRVDLRKDQTVTIDNIDTNDIDDALCYVGVNNAGHDVVRISIADVPHYVKEGSASDLFAKSVTSSAYAPNGKAFHMLHQAYSKGICSLNPGVDRLARTYELAFDKNGNIVMEESKMYLSVINSKMKMDKETVNKVLKGEKVERYELFTKSLLKLNEIAKRIRGKRLRNGLINFPPSEPKFTFDSSGKVVDVSYTTPTEADDLIEDFMISTGLFQGNLYLDKGLRAYYRVEEDVSSKKVDELLDALELQGIHIEKKSVYTSRDIQEILKTIHDKPFYHVFAERLIRTMPKAYYSTVNIGHVGLAVPVYAQCTSPIRRDGDRGNHEIDYKHIDKDTPQTINEIRRIEAHACRLSRSELKYQKFERACDDYYITQYMSKFVGQNFEARIFNFAKDGIELFLENGTRGFLKYNTLNDVKVDTSSKHMIKFTFFNSNSIYKIGDAIKVILDKSDMQRRTVYYRLDEKVLSKKI